MAEAVAIDVGSLFRTSTVQVVQAVDADGLVKWVTEQVQSIKEAAEAAARGRAAAPDPAAAGANDGLKSQLDALKRDNEELVGLVRQLKDKQVGRFACARGGGAHGGLAQSTRTRVHPARAPHTTTHTAGRSFRTNSIGRCSCWAAAGRPLECATPGVRVLHTYCTSARGCRTGRRFAAGSSRRGGCVKVPVMQARCGTF